VMAFYLKASGHPVIDRSALSEADIVVEKSTSLWAAVSPWLILTALAVCVNAPFLPFFDLTFNKLTMPVEIIPNSVEKMRILWQAYFLILISSLLALPFLKPTRSQLSRTCWKWLKRAPRPMVASGVFFAIAYLYNHSGKGADWQLSNANYNMVTVLASASATAFGKLYPLVAPYLGLLAGFISGSEASAIAMLTKLHRAAAEQIGAAGLLIAAASGIGGGLASVISPAKLQNASASIDRIGEEARVIPTTFIISILITLVCALMTLLWAYG
jgi:lactate permease